MSHNYRDFSLRTRGKERMDRSTEAVAMIFGEDLTRWHGGPEVIDLGDDGRQLPRETEGTDDAH